MAKTAFVSLLALAFLLCSCGPAPSSSASGLPEFTDDSWYRSIDSLHSYAQESDSRSGLTPLIERGDGFITGTELPDKSSYQASFGDIFMHDYGGACVYIGEEGVADGKVVPGTVGLFYDGWYDVYPTSTGFYHFRPFESGSKADILQKAFYRTMFSLNSHCDYVSKLNEDWMLEGSIDVALGAFSHDKKEKENGVATRDGDYSWVEEGEPFTYYNGRFVEEETDDLRTRFRNQAHFRSLASAVDQFPLSPLPASFGLFEEKESRFLLAIDQSYADPNAHTTFYFEITLDATAKYLATMRVYYESYLGNEIVETFSSDYRFGGFGTTKPLIPEEIIARAKEAAASSSQFPWSSWSRR